jgi:RNA polymerase II subunit A C-terminal domain phosphatase
VECTKRSLGASDRSQRSNISVRGKKHPRDETDDDETDEESSLAKKQRLARVRTTGLKTVKTPNSAKSESSLPTPEITGEEELDDVDQLPNADDEGDVDEDDLEAEMMAEFEKERDWGEEPQDDDTGYGDEDDDEGG